MLSTRDFLDDVRDRVCLLVLELYVQTHPFSISSHSNSLKHTLLIATAVRADDLFTEKIVAGVTIFS